MLKNEIQRINKPKVSAIGLDHGRDAPCYMTAMKIITTITLAILAAPHLVNASPYRYSRVKESSVSICKAPNVCKGKAGAREPPSRRDSLSDVDILNFALTLEHLENQFYIEGLAKFSEEDFTDAGHPDWTRSRFKQIAAHEKTQVEFISSALTAAGAKDVLPCEYEFPYTDVNSWIDLSYMLGSISTSAYNGAAGFIDNKAYLTVAASILGVKARQVSWINSAVRKLNGWNSPFETPLNMNQAYTLASPFIQSCPSSNPSLPVKSSPQLTVPPCAEGQRVQLSFDAPGADRPQFMAFISGTGTTFVQLSENKEVTIPGGLEGMVFAVITTDGEIVNDETTIAGPTMLQFNFDSSGKLE